MDNNMVSKTIIQRMRSSLLWLSTVLFSLTGGTLLTSCTPEAEDVFGESAANRVADRQAEYYAILESQEQGWALDFYPSDFSLGGVAYTAIFKDGEVRMTCEQTIKNTVTAVTYPAGSPFVSNYQIMGETGVILTFDTYNPLFHYWSQPFTGHAKGYQSDYEFTFLSATAEQVVLRGKKYGNLLKMYPLKEDAATYVNKVKQTRNTLSNIVRKRLVVDGTTYPVTLAFNRLDYVADGTTQSVPFIYTADGIRLYEPVSIGGVTVEQFSYDASADELQSMDQRAVMPTPNVAERFIGTTGQWYFGYTNANGAFDMCDDLKAIVDDCAKKIKKPNWGYEVLNAIYLGGNLLDVEADTHRLIIGFISRDGYGSGNPAFFGYAISMDMVDGERQTISLQALEAATGFGDRNYCQAIIDFIAEGSPYQLSFDDQEHPTMVTLTSVQDETKWFKLRVGN